MFFRLIMSRLNRGRGGAPGGHWGATLRRLPRLEGGARLNSPSDGLIAIRLPRPWQRLQPPEASVSRVLNVGEKMKYYWIKMKLCYDFNDLLV